MSKKTKNPPVKIQFSLKEISTDEKSTRVKNYTRKTIKFIGKNHDPENELTMSLSFAGALAEIEVFMNALNVNALEDVIEGQLKMIKRQGSLFEHIEKIDDEQESENAPPEEDSEQTDLL